MVLTMNSMKRPGGMDFQTPLKKARKSVMFETTVEASPLRRKTVVLQSGTPQINKVNDDIERDRRRSNVDIHRRLSRLPNSPSPAHETACSEQECKEHILAAIKLYSENKISSKNAWKINIIDYLRMMFKSSSFGTDSLQVATTSLDASTKVYSLRVDDIYTEGLKLASNMARITQNSRGGINDDLNEDESLQGTEKGDQQAKRQKKRRKFQKGIKNTIVKDPKTMFSSFPKIESTSYQSKTDKDNVGTTTLFSLGLPMDYCGTNHLLSHNKPFSMEDPLLEIDETIITKLVHTSIQICPPLNTFHLDKWNIDDENELTMPEREVLYDNTGMPIPELDGSIHEDLFEPPPEINSHSDEEEVIGACHEAGTRVAEEIVSVSGIPSLQHLMHTDNDYSYHSQKNNSIVKLVFAGPSHWKLKYIKRSVARFSGQVAKPNQKASRKQRVLNAPIISYSEEKINLEEFDFDDQVPPPKKTKFNDPLRVTLPMKYKCDLTGYLSRQFAEDVGNKNKSWQPVTDYQAEPYNYNNMNDSQYCSQNDDGIGGDDDHDDNFIPETQQETILEEVQAGQAGNMVDNLVEAPEMVEKNSLMFVKTAKKMDMRRLKLTMWKTMVATTTEPYEKLDSNSLQDKRAQPHKFSEVLSEISPRLTEKMREDLSPHMAFVALLHLCNEHNLELVKEDTLNDFTILPAAKRKGG